MRVLVTRPREDGEEIAAHLAALGHEAILAPLLEVHFQDGAQLPLEGVQAILATSANGIRAFSRRSTRRDLPIFAVGPQTAKAARQAGFAQVKNADGDARALAEAAARWTTPDKGALLHISAVQGESVLADRLAQSGFAYRKAVLYDIAAAKQLPSQAAKALAAGALDAALFFSPRSAAVFRDCAIRENLDGACAGLLAICISAATAGGLAPLRFAEIRLADAPNQESLLARLAH